MAGEGEHGPRALAEHEARHVVGSDVEAIARGHAFGHQQLDAAEQLLVLEFLVGEPDQRFERDLIAERVVTAHLEHLGADEALDQAEHVGVGAALHLAEEAALVGIEEFEFVGQGQAVEKEVCMAFGEMARLVDVSGSFRRRPRAA